MTEIDWAHRESLRMWNVLAARGHEGAQAVAAHHGLAPLPPVVPAPARAVAPQVPRPAAAPAAPQPTVALTGVSRRVDMLTKLISPPVPPDFV